MQEKHPIGRSSDALRSQRTIALLKPLSNLGNLNLGANFEDDIYRRAESARQTLDV